jgi:signal transduction histidine kinase/CheY-like chemotaxis protein
LGDHQRAATGKHKKEVIESPFGKVDRASQPLPQWPLSNVGTDRKRPVISLLQILYLEDEPKDAELVQATLEAANVVCSVTRVETRPEFLGLLERGGFDLILADYTLPSFDGISALKMVKKVRPDVPFIFVSGTLGEEIAIEALKLGATDYVFKNRLARILPSVQRALREAEERTERKRAEEALRRNEAYLAEAQRLSRTGSFGWDVAREDIYWSEETFRIFECDSSTKPTLELVLQRTHPEDKVLVGRLIDSAVQERKEFDFEHRLLMADGSVKYIRVVGHPSLNNESGNFEFVGAVTDITERKQAEEALRRSEQRIREVQADLAHVNRVTTMGELTTSLAHEVNQPIAATVTDANTCLRWLDRDQPDLKEARAAASRIVRDATRAAEIIKRVRQLFKKGGPERELVDVNEIAQEILFLLRSEAMQYSISVRTELASDLPRVIGDRVHLQQVLMNLIMNSIDAMKDVDGTRELCIKSQRTETGQLLVSVTDTGIGLPPQHADQIFDAFFTTKPDGTGMGLRISRSVVESHGGRLWAADNPPRGASFCFTLPTDAA